MKLEGPFETGAFDEYTNDFILTALSNREVNELIKGRLIYFQRDNIAIESYHVGRDAYNKDPDVFKHLKKLPDFDFAGDYFKFHFQEELEEARGES